MTRGAVAATLVLMGVIVARVTLVDRYLFYVKGSLAIPLLLSAAMLVALGIATAWEPLARRRRDAGVAPPRDEGRSGETDHGHAGIGPRLGMLLVAPLVALLVLPPAPLGSFAASNGAANRLPPSTAYEPLPEPTDGAVDVVLTEAVGRALVDPDSLDGAVVRTEGFVVPIDDGAYLLSRFAIGCCAVDAAPFQLFVDTAGAPVPSREQWVSATLVMTGEVAAEGDDRYPVFQLVSQEPIPAPADPYLY